MMTTLFLRLISAPFFTSPLLFIIQVFLDLKEISQEFCFFLPVKDRVATVGEKSGDFVLKSVKSQKFILRLYQIILLQFCFKIIWVILILLIHG